MQLKLILKEQFEKQGIDGVLVADTNNHKLTFYILEENKEIVKNIAYNNLPAYYYYDIEELQYLENKGLMILETKFCLSKALKEKGITILPRNKFCQFLIKKFLSK